MKKMKRINKILVIAICLLLSALGVISQIKSNQESSNIVKNLFTNKNDTVTEQQIKENKDD